MIGYLLREYVAAASSRLEETLALTPTLYRRERGAPAPYLFSVAQIANLPYRRLQIGRALAVFQRPGQGAVLQDGILRYSAARRSRNQYDPTTDGHGWTRIREN